MGFHHEWRRLLHFFRMGEPTSQGIVHHHLEWPTAALGGRLQIGSDVGVEGEGGSHIVMLSERHHDVYF